MRTSKESGFTLIELMVTVLVAAILAAVAVPAYIDYVKRSKISQATSNLSSMRVKLEQYFQDNRTFEGACKDKTIAPLPPADDFAYSCPTLTDFTYTVEATGAAPGAMTGFTYTIDHENKMMTTAVPGGWGAAPKECWIVKKGGAC